MPFGECYFYEENLEKFKFSSRLNFLIQSKVKRGLVVKRTRTVVIDLRQKEEDIFAKLHKNYRYEINRSKKTDSVLMKWNIKPTNEEIDSFCSYYDDFALSINLPHSNRTKLYLFNRSQSLILSQAKLNTNKALVQHALIYDNGRVRLLYSASYFRNEVGKLRALIGRSNKALHWFEILEAKKKGCKLYDFGGVSIKGETGCIDNYKRNFGGATWNEYTCVKLQF